MIIERECGVKGSYQLKVRRGATGVIDDINFDNVLTDLFFSIETSNLYLQVGTGTSTPDQTDVNLQSPIGTRGFGLKTADPVVINGSGFTAKSNIEVTWAIGAIIGNISEVGAFYSSSGSTMVSRALITDGAGNPTTVTITADDQLILTYVLTLNFMPVNESLPLVIDGITTDVSIISGGELSNWAKDSSSCFEASYILRSNYLVFCNPANPISHPASQGAKFTGDSGGNIVTNANMVLSYGAGQKSVTLTHTAQASQLNTYPSVTQAMIAIEGSFGIAYGALLFEFSPAISKTNQKSFTLSYKITMARA